MINDDDNPMDSVGLAIEESEEFQNAIADVQITHAEIWIPLIIALLILILSSRVV